MKNSLPSFTVVTPVLNQVSYIDEMIRSVLLQHYPRLEFLVMDGKSTDGTLDMIKEYENSLKWVSEKDKGQSDAINKGLRMATGEIVGYLNADDYYLPGALRIVGQYFQDHPETVWVTGSCRIVDHSGAVIRKGVKRWKDFWLSVSKHMSPRLFRSSLNMLNFISQPSTFFRKKALEKIGFFDTRLDYVMDYDYWIRLNTLGKPGIISHPLACFRVHNRSKTSNEYRSFCQESIRVIKRHTRNPIVLSAHRLHSRLTDLSYRHLFPL